MKRLEDQTSAFGCMPGLYGESGPTPAGLFVTASGWTGSLTQAGYAALPGVERTSAGPVGIIEPIPTGTIGSAVLEIRRRSGLTFEELADLFNVSRRAIHHWANGKTVSSAHERAVRQVLAAIRFLDRGDATANRGLLLSTEAGATSLFVHLKAGDFAAVNSFTGRSASLGEVRLPLSHAAEAARRPPNPAALLDGNAERPKIATRGSVVRVVRARRDAG